VSPLRPPLRAAASSCLTCLAASAAFAAATAPLRAQDTLSAPTVRIPLALLAGDAEQRERLAQLRGERAADGFLLRALGQRVARERERDGDGAGDGLVVLLPELTTTYNSAHPWGWNDGPLRAGKGANLLVSGGFAIRSHGVTLQIVPQLVHEANLYLPVIPYGENQEPPRRVWANPFHPAPENIDYPLRFGDQPRTVLRGQHRFSVSVPGRLRVGFSSENRWWGPGVRNALLLGSQGPGFSHLFAESRTPWRTPAGDFEVQYVLGSLRESDFFDFDEGNDIRSLSAAAVTWRPPEGLDALLPEIGLARGVMAAGSPQFRNALDFLRDAGRPFADSADATRGRDQITSLFARWLIPASGFEAWMEWARYEQPVDLRDLVVNPGHSQGYTLGASWAKPYRDGALQLQGEFTYAEPSASIRVRPVGISYTSPSVPQGWTHEGEMLGPAVGPGGSSQWAALDWHRDAPPSFTSFTRLTRLGLSLGRLRRDNGEPFEQPAESFKREDISLWATLRVGWRIGPLDALVEFTDAARLNYLYQAFDLPPEEGGWAGVDLRNQTIALTLTPRRR
jgi:hypothetical protein